MGTISDKLMRVINTKEDIRKALISKGYDVPASIPFKEYAKMILDLPCKIDDFPELPGDVTRWHFGGLTNEMMAAMDDPRIEDADHKGRFLSFKNFAWKGMSGVGGYVVDIDEWGTNSTAAYFERNSIKITATFKENASLGLLYHNIKLRQSCVLKVTGIPKGCDAFLDDRLGNRFYMSEDGVYEIIPSNFLAEALYLSIEKYPERWYGSKLTIEQLPLYPGALVFDGVDDYGVCDNFPILTKEKGYTVVALRQWLSFQDIGYPTLVVNSTDRLAAFSFEDFRSKTKSTWNWGRSVGLSDYKIPLLYTYQTFTSYNSKTIYAGATEEGSNILQVCRSGIYCANAAIWEIVILDHDATEEELTKIKDYFVKTYPWLFPDQAWTVVGKTNEDEDRATIANITGNGNDLVLSNFAFSGNSGYGEYAYNFNDTSWISIPDYGVISDKTSKSFNIKSFVLADYPVLYTAVNKDSSIKKVKIKVTNSIPGFYFGNKPANQIIDLSTDGIYEIPSYNSPNDVTQYGFRCSNVNDSCNITIEQIPEYEGYLVTDGVDDIASSNTFVYEADFTFIGEWKFIQKDNTVAGINSLSHLYIQNRYNRGATVMINSTFENKKNITDYMTFKAITSKGKGYDENWNEVDLLYGDGNKGTSGVNIGGQGGTEFCHMLFKNMALYMNKVFSKDECIKAYNYLQTIKSK